jgi:hypothetical protein
MHRGFHTALSKWRKRHSARAPTGLSFAVTERHSQLNQHAWNAVTHQHGLGLSSRYLEALERSRTPNLTYRYALGFEDDVPVLAVSMQILDASVDRLRPARASGLWAGFETSSLEQRIRQRVLVCGNMLTSGFSGYARSPQLEADRAVRAVAEVLYRVRRAEKLSGHTNIVLLKDFSECELAESRSLEDLSYRPLPGGPSMVLALDSTWRTHDDYLATMQSKYRSSVKRRIFAPIEAAGCSVLRLSLEQVARHRHRLQHLYTAVQDNASIRPVTVSEDYWPAMAALNDCVVLAVVRESEILGFLLCFSTTNEIHASAIGFDRHAAQTLPLYLRLLHAAVEEGLARRAIRVVLGRTALEPKARMGARPVDTFMWVRHRVPVVNALARPLVEFVRPAAAPDIDPFRRA